MLTNDDSFWHQPNRKTYKYIERQEEVYAEQQTSEFKTKSTDNETAINITDTQINY